MSGSWQINSLNVKKSKFMLFHMPQKSIQKPTLNIGISLLESVDCFNFLGIHFDKHLSQKTIGILNKLKHHIPLINHIQLVDFITYKLWYFVTVFLIRSNFETSKESCSYYNAE